MYRIGLNYKIELKNNIFYTAKILEEKQGKILIKTIRDEELIIDVSEIKRALLLDRTEEDTNERI
jgi:hypothetical protein